jgi:hypothetical protein
MKIMVSLILDRPYKLDCDNIKPATNCLLLRIIIFTRNFKTW